MPESTRPRVLVVDDDPAVLRALRQILEGSYDVLTAASGQDALAVLDDSDPPPGLVLLDIRMPDMDGYQVCAHMQEREELAWIPVIFLTALEGDDDRQRAFAVGATDYMAKPFERDALMRLVAEHLRTGQRWSSMRKAPGRAQSWLLPSTFVAFKRYLLEQMATEGAAAEAANAVRPDRVYEIANLLRIPEEQLARYLARFLDLPYMERVDPDDLALGKLPRTFCAANHVLVLRDRTVVVANPFDWELMDVLERTLWSGGKPIIAITAPDRTRQLLDDKGEEKWGDRAQPGGTIPLDSAHEPGDSGVLEAQAVANEILRGAIADRASDVHIEPKERGALVRYRIDGDMHDIRTLAGTMAARLISRLKALAGMDIAEKRKPQDGALPVTLGNRQFKLRLATSSTAQGETLVLRILEPEAHAMPLEDLGFTTDQATRMRGLADRSQGLILIVGPTGSGKSTTIFSVLSGVDGRSRSIMSVEDPVEYRIPYANQQQVHERAGVTFEALLRSAMRQDPDILFLGEVRDSFSARAAMDFASSGHVTVSTLHSSNSTTAVFRLERLGVERGGMADAISGVVAQKLLKKLCPECRVTGPITREELAMLAGFTDDPPETVGRPVGCPACRETGYQGREVVGELLLFDSDVARLVRDGHSIAAIRSFCVDRGDFFIARHAIEKIRSHGFAVRDVYEHVLVEERAFGPDRATAGRTQHGTSASGSAAAADPTATTAHAGAAGASAPPDRQSPAPARGDAPPGEPTPSRESRVPPSLRAPSGAPLVLVVDDEPDIRALVELHLTNAGYQVIMAADGIEALMQLGSRNVDIVLSDVNMPNLDGVKLMEMIGQKGVAVPAVFLTASDDEALEQQLLEMGAADYLRKPVRKEVLLMRLRNAIRARDALSEATT
jgi:type II secretory ATPase GspE/PulE/Tfp pilus assembly ATPase PilB-like protein/DNA-binding response OmpR family regulator